MQVIIKLLVFYITWEIWYRRQQEILVTTMIELQNNNKNLQQELNDARNEIDATKQTLHKTQNE